MLLNIKLGKIFFQVARAINEPIIFCWPNGPLIQNGRCHLSRKFPWYFKYEFTIKVIVTLKSTGDVDKMTIYFTQRVTRGIMTVRGFFNSSNSLTELHEVNHSINRNLSSAFKVWFSILDCGWCSGGRSLPKSCGVKHLTHWGRD